MIEAVRRYAGDVVQSTGGSIFALFGAPLVHEDHSQRSLYAALRMQEELSGYSAKVVADGGMPIEARVGVNTDEVVVRSIQTGAGQVDTHRSGIPPISPRTQTAPPVGSIAVSAAGVRQFVPHRTSAFGKLDGEGRQMNPKSAPD
jgi:hypothetical protein